MTIKLIRKTQYLFLIVALTFIWLVTASAQAVRFVQITDPHLFDTEKEEAENKVALAACIKNLNERVDSYGKYDFAVITGDIGIENLVSKGKDSNGSILADKATRDQRIEQGAAQLASILAPSKISVWLLLPGNNDLLNEEPDTQYYRTFVQQLQTRLPQMTIIDLCPPEPPGKDPTGIYKVGKAAFIGFNNASFKNDNAPARVTANKTKQVEYVDQVVTRIGSADVAIAYVFYHIPELDDPYVVLDFDTTTLAKRGKDSTTPAIRNVYDSNPYPYSSWFVDKSVHDEWRKVIANPKVRGLFAGHYHDWRRDTYTDYSWVRTSDYLSSSLSKLYVCPPLAIKRQDKTSGQARGFQELTVDAAGRIERKIVWFNPTSRNFDSEPSSQDNQFQLGLFYERAHDWTEAEKHFAEAAGKAQSSSSREAALAGLARVTSSQPVWLKTVIAWTDPRFLAPYVSRLLVAMAILALIVAVSKGSRAMVIYAFEGDADMSKVLAVGFPAARARVAIVLEPSDHVFLPQESGTVYPFVSPGLDQWFPQESIEIAGVKVPNLNVLLKWLARPRFQVTGAVAKLSGKKYIYAEIWRRHFWFGTRLANLSVREIPFGYEGHEEVENFIFDVYLKARDAIL